MGHSLSILSYHNLDTRSVEAVGSKLALRFGVNVECYYRDNYDLDLWLKNDFPTYNEHLLAAFETAGANVTWQLYDENYLQKKLYAQHGESIKEHPLFKKEPNELKEFMDEVNEFQYELYHKTADKTDWLADIHERLWQCEFHYFSKWWSFCECFMGKDWLYKLDNLNEFRRELKNTLLKMGADSAVYVDDQGESESFVYDAYGATSWGDFVAGIKNRFGEKCLHVPGFMKQGAPLNDGDYPLAFYDDFSDLK